MLKFTTGDMFSIPADIRVNTVNCVGVMGAGVALAFKERYPEMFREYKRECDAGRVRPGELHVWRSLSDWVINFPTKRHWRENSRYEDIESGLVALREYLLKLGPVKVALPALGCGHGGLDWTKVSAMIREHLEGLDAEIIVFDPADSRKVAKTGAHDQLSHWAVVHDGDEFFPANLARSGIRELSYSGERSSADWDIDVAVLLSSKPDERETAAATGCVAELARPGLKFCLVMGTAASTKLATLILEKGGSVTGWVPQGLDRFKAPQALSPALAKGTLTLVSVAKQHQSWNPGFASKSSVAALRMAKASLFVDPAPRWLSGLPDQDLHAEGYCLFYLRYLSAAHDMSEQWQSLHARAIGRRSSDGKPNVEPILQAIAADQPETAAVAASTRSKPDPVLREDPTPSPSSPSSMPQSYPKRLIEVDLPIRRISAHARREKSIRHGHISTLHIWWARRPLAACRAVICAALWPDPADANCPDSFRSAAAKQMRDFAKKITGDYKLAEKHCSPENFKVWKKLTSGPETLASEPVELRSALLDFIADFANWDNSTVREYLDTSRALTQAAHEALGGAPGTRPLVVDPFAGGGSIPLEALRVGADAFASDLNPVPVLLNKVVLEYIPKYRQRLADEVRKWGKWIKREAEKELAEFYPTDADGTTPIAYLWARTIQCEGPGCGAEVPLIRNMQITRDGRKWHFNWEFLEGKSIGVQVGCGEVSKSRPSVAAGSATCPRKECGYTTPAKAVRVQLQRQNGGAKNAKFLAVCVQSDAGKVFRAPSQADERGAAKAKQASANAALPEDEINSTRPYKNTRGLSAVTRIGITQFGHLYTSRQALAIRCFQRLLLEIPSDCCEPGLRTATLSVLHCAVSRFVFQNCSLSRWHATRSTLEGAFGKQALQIVWDFAEANPISDGPANWDGAIDWVTKVIDANSVLPRAATVCRARAQDQTLPDDAASALITDPPYFAAIPYSDLSNFFFVWERDFFREIHPDLYSTGLVKQEDEIIVTNANLAADGTQKSPAFYKTEMAKALVVARRVVAPDGIGVIVFADSSTDSWEAILGAVIESGWIVTGSWPIDTELQNRTQADASASLQSSIHLVCRPRESPDGSVRTDEVGDWRDVLRELPHRIHEWMPRLAEEGVVGADAIFACLGPALEIFSRYSRVEKASGDAVTLKEYLEHVWAAVSKEALSVIFEGANTEGFEPDARLTAMWLWTLAGPAKDPNADETEDEEADDEDKHSGKKGKKKGGFTLEYDAARKIAQGLGAHLEDLGSMVEVSGETARLLPVAERTAYLFGKEHAEEPMAEKRRKKQAAQPDLFAELAQEGVSEKVWTEKTVSKIGETTLDRIHQSMILFAASRSEALKRFLVDDGAGRDQRFWRLAQALSALYPPKCEEKRWVDGVLARKKGLGL